MSANSRKPVYLRIYGEPRPQGNKTGFVRGGKVVMVEGRRSQSREDFRSWRQAIEQAGADWLASGDGLAPLDGPVIVFARFLLTRPSSLPRWRWLPWTRPDVDKLARALSDGLTGHVICNDSRVVSSIVEKYFAEGQAPGALVWVTPVDERSGHMPPIFPGGPVIAPPIDEWAS